MVELPICHTCGSDDVMVDAWAVWDVKSQSWDLRSTYPENAFCNACEGETTLKWTSSSHA